MKSELMRKKASIILASTVGCFLILAGCSSSDDTVLVTDDSTPATDDLPDITVSGVITDINDGPLTGVTVQGVYTNSTTTNPSTSTDTSGGFSLTLEADTGFYLSGTFLGYVTLNSEILNTNVNITGLDIEMPRSPEFEASIEQAFPTAVLSIVNHAWLAVDIEDVNGNQISDITITPDITPSGFAYTNCDGSPRDRNTTIACAERAGPMYIAYFDEVTVTSVTAAEQSKTAPLRIEQLSALEYAIAPELLTAFVRGASYYDVYCTECHSAGSYDVDGFATNLLGTTIIQELSLYPSMSMVADLTPEQQADLQAFVSDPSLL